MINQNTIVSRMTGGTGNQMFALAAGYALSQKLGFKLGIDLGGDGTYGNRVFTLNEIAKANDIQIINSDFPVFREVNPFEYQDSFWEITESVTLEGYFQSYRYLQDVSLPSLQSLFFGESLEKVEKLSQINIHVRRGDYLIPKHSIYHGVCSDDYFCNAVSILRSIWGELPVFVFSENREDVADLLSAIEGSSFVETNGMHELSVIRMISSSQCLVTSNSSFSWWAGYLGGFKYGNIVLPEPWYLKNKDFSELYVPGWMRVKN
jgi:hypothetical protein